MIDRAAIRSSLRAHLQGVAGYPGNTLVAWEGTKFDPPQPGKGTDNKATPPPLWLRENMNWGEEVLVATNLLEQISFMQIDVMIPLGTGTKQAETMAKAIGDHFKPGTERLGTGVQIAVQRAVTQKGMESSVGEQVWYQLPVRIMFRAYGTNNE